MIAYSRRNLLLIRYSTTIDEERKPPAPLCHEANGKRTEYRKSTDSNLSAIRPEAKYARVDYISDACDGCMCVYVYTMDFCRVSNSEVRRVRLFRACALCTHETRDLQCPRI